MRIRKVKNATSLLNQNATFINNPKEYKNHWQEVFNNNNKIHLEIGCGKGKFLTEKARNNPNINFIGIEKSDSVLVRATEKELSPNIRFILMDAIELTDIFGHEIDTLYLNFSDPWPKKKHHKRRLTSNTFLKLYESIFANGIHIIQKTDNTSLWEYSIEEYSKNHFIIEKAVYDYQSEDNIETEYETKFRSMGLPIHYLEIKK